MKKNELYDLVKQAYIYAFPVYEMYRTRYNSVYNPSNPERTDLNQFIHMRQLADHTTRFVTTPNNDTPYSMAWIDLLEEPIVLSVPDTDGRYFVMELLDFFTNNFANIGKRTTGTTAGNFVICGPDFTGDLPSDLPVYKSPTNTVWLIGRTLAKSESDMPEIHRIQNQYRLTAFSEWQEGTHVTKRRSSEIPAMIRPEVEEMVNFFQVVNAGLTENAPPAEESDLMKEFEKISIGPNQVFITDQLQGENKQTWLQAANDGFQEMRKAFFSLYKDLNGWALCPRHMGDYGQDYLYRAYIALTGLGGLVPEEAIYLPNIRKKGTPTLSGQNRYLLHFDKNNLPPVGAFWSLAMYEITMDRRQYFAQNPINRYSIGNFTDGIQYNSDGSLDIYIQNQLPVHDRESNWLPAPEGNFSMVMRAFEPEPSIINGEYQFPEIQILGSSL